MERTKRQIRTISSEFKTREDGEEKHISGYFAVFNSNYEMDPYMSESIAPGAFSKSMGNDVRALVNHDTTLVLGRTKAHTLELREDSRGLWGDITINPNDSDAMNLYSRVQRGDVDQCSFGFEIVSEEADFREDGTIHWTIKDINLFEVSCCTFPAYEETSIKARSDEREKLLSQRLDAWKTLMKERVRNGFKSLDDSEESER